MCLMSLVLFDTHTYIYILPISILNDARNLYRRWRLYCFQVFSFLSPPLSLSFFLLSLSYDLIIIFLFHSLIATVKNEQTKETYRGGRHNCSLICAMLRRWQRLSNYQSFLSFTTIIQNFLFFLVLLSFV